MGPRSLQALEAATSAAIAAKKPLALLFVVDDELRSYMLLRLLSDPGVGDAVDQVVWAKLPWAKDSAEAKAHKIAAPAAIVLLDPTSSPPKPIKTLRAAAPAALRKELLDAAKAVNPDAARPR